MKVMLVNGSPHKEGCTYTALKEVEIALNKNGIDTEIFWIGTKPISGCIGCRSCAFHKKCVFDDVVNEFVDKAEKADGFVFGTPVHYAAMSGSLTSFMDRVFYSSSCSGRNVFAHKPAAGICSARRSGTTVTYDQLNKYFGINQMPIISSRYWNMVHGNTKEEVLEDKEGMQVMRILGNNMAYFLKCIEAGREKGIKLTKEEDITLTNFIRS
jgi:multimeric flavodoxin WrbA